MTSSLLWDQHTCLPLRADAAVDPLTRYRRPAGTLVSVKGRVFAQPFNEAIALLQRYRSAVDAHPRMELADNLNDVEAIARGLVG